MAHVIMRAPFRLARAQRQHQRGAVQRLNLTFFIDRQEQRAIRRVQIQPNDVTHFVDKQRILRQLEGVHAMRLQGKGLRDARDPGLTHVALRGQAPRRPVRRIARRRFEGGGQDAFHISIGDFPRYARPRFVRQPVKPLREESATPFADHLFRDLDIPRDRGGCFAGRTSQHESRSQRQRLGRCRTAHPPPSVSRSSIVSTMGATGRPSRIGVSSL